MASNNAVVEYLPEVGTIVLFSGIFIGGYCYRGLRPMYKNLYYYILILFGSDILSRILWKLFDNNLIVLHVYSFFELLFFTYYYNKFLYPVKSLFVKVLGSLGLLYIIYEVFVYFVFASFDIKQYQPYSKVVDNFIIIIYALGLLHKKIVAYNETNWDNFWLNMVFLIFFTFNTIIFLPVNFLVNENTGLKFYFWTANVIALVFFYIYLITLIWKSRKQVP